LPEGGISATEKLCGEHVFVMDGSEQVHVFNRTDFARKTEIGNTCFIKRRVANRKPLR
jgi:hypothetical protein